jgi:hypothetical protein
MYPKFVLSNPIRKNHQNIYVVYILGWKSRITIHVLTFRAQKLTPKVL